jgi:hypothetical protein
LEEVVSSLYDALKSRKRPEEVAKLILESGAAFSPRERALLDRAAKARQYSYMRDDFREAVLPQRQATALAKVSKIAEPESYALADLESFLSKAARKIKASPDALDFKKDRLNRGGRRKARLGKIGKRAYNRRFRMLRSFSHKLNTFGTQLDICDAMMVAKSGMATRITPQAFAVSPEAACFVAYYTARRNRRSTFTNVGQESAFDDVSEMLLKRVGSGWLAVAHVFQDRRVMDHLIARQKTQLMLLSLDELRKLAILLGKAWEGTRFDLSSMIVKRGDDSSTWNALAGAWNMTRKAYFSMLSAMGAEHLVEDCCPGKVMRLMAADVAYWHRASGGDVDPGTKVWAMLPPPWEVLSGKQKCGRAEVVRACKVNGLDPYATGWLPVVGEAHTVPFTPTPELVHGVAVSTPQLAKVLKKAGWFSGKSGVSVEGVSVEREDGFATFAKED